MNSCVHSIRAVIGALATFSLALGGCASVVPKYDISNDSDGAPSPRAIVNKITCDLASLVAMPGQNDLLLIEDVVVTVQLNLTVNDTGGLAPTFTYMNGPLTLNANATFSQSREQNFTSMLHYSMKTLKDEIKAGRKINFDITKCENGPTNLEGNLGIKENVDLALRTPNVDWTAKFTGASGGAFGGYVDFVVTKNVGAGPNWVLKHFTGPGKLASVSEVNTDKITFAFARGDTSTKKETAALVAKTDKMIDTINLNQLTTQLKTAPFVLQ